MTGFKQYDTQRIVFTDDEISGEYLETINMNANPPENSGFGITEDEMVSCCRVFATENKTQILNAIRQLC